MQKMFRYIKCWLLKFLKTKNRKKRKIHTARIPGHKTGTGNTEEFADINH